MRLRRIVTAPRKVNRQVDGLTNFRLLSCQKKQASESPARHEDSEYFMLAVVAIVESS
jgi:hypothetical protein